MDEKERELAALVVKERNERVAELIAQVDRLQAALAKTEERGAQVREDLDRAYRTITHLRGQVSALDPKPTAEARAEAMQQAMEKIFHWVIIDRMAVDDALARFEDELRQGWAPSRCKAWTDDPNCLDPYAGIHLMCSGPRCDKREECKSCKRER